MTKFELYNSNEVFWRTHDTQEALRWKIKSPDQTGPTRLGWYETNHKLFFNENLHSPSLLILFDFSRAPCSSVIKYEPHKHLVETFKTR